MLPILKLPYLAQLEALKHLEVYEQFFLGLCSTRAKLLVQTRRQDFDETVIDVRRYLVTVKNSGKKKRQEVVMWASTLFRPEHKYLVPKETDKDRKICFWYKGTRIRCGISFHFSMRGIPIIWCKDKYKRLIPLALQDSICDVFNLSRKIQIAFKMSKVSEFPETDVVDNLSESASRFTYPGYSQFFKELQIKNCAKIRLPEDDILDPDHRIFSTPHLHIHGKNKLSREHLLRFGGRSFTLSKCQSINMDGIIDFVKNWKSGGSENLEFLLITLDRCGWFHNNKFWEDFEGKPWDADKRGGRFKNPETMETTHQIDLLDCTQQLDIQRDSGGL